MGNRLALGGIQEQGNTSHYLVEHTQIFCSAAPVQTLKPKTCIMYTFLSLFSRGFLVRVRVHFTMLSCRFF